MFPAPHSALTQNHSVFDLMVQPTVMLTASHPQESHMTAMCPGQKDGALKGDWKGSPNPLTELSPLVISVVQVFCLFICFMFVFTSNPP